MDITFDDFNNYAYSISIDSKRFDLQEKVFLKHCLKARLFRGQTTTDKRGGAKMCLESHKRLLLMAEHEDFPFVVAYEDDAYPRADIQEKLQMYLADIPDDCDLLVLGWSRNDNDASSKHNKIHDVVFGSHAYICFRSGYRKMIDFMEKTDVPMDYTFYQNPDLNSYIVDECLYIQYNETQSFIGGHAGYIADYRNKVEANCPEGFNPIEYYTGHKFILNNDVDNVDNINEMNRKRISRILDSWCPCGFVPFSRT